MPRSPRRPIRPAGSPILLAGLFGLLIALGALALPRQPVQARPAGPAAPQATVQPSRTPAPTSTPDPATGLCTVTGEQLAEAPQVEIRRPLGMRLRLQADCPLEARGRADIFLVVDTSTSMAELGKFEAAKAAVRKFIDEVDFDRHRVGLIPFSNNPFVAQPLTFNTDYIRRALDAAGPPSGSTNIAAAIAMADTELQIAGRREAVHIVVLLTDGRSAPEPMFAAAEAAKRRGLVLFTIGLGDDAAQAELQRVATSPDHFSFAPGPEALEAIYTRIASMIREVMVTDLVLVDRLGQAVGLVAGSSRPMDPALLAEGRHPTWTIPFLTSDPFVLDYQVTIDRAGRLTPSEAVWVDYADGDGRRRRAAIEPAEVEVIVPDTHWIHLPVLWRNACVPSPHYSDVVLAIDTSASMAGAKLQQAVAAAMTFVDLLDLRTNRAAVVSYDGSSRVVQALTADRVLLQQALYRLSPSPGTRIDLGLMAATEHLMDPIVRSERRPAIVLLSDGQQVEAQPMVYQAAGFARDRGITIYTIGLGEDADRALLRAVAGSPSRAFFAPTAAELADIYREVAGAVGCK